jgi:hypothetical protein
VHHRLGTLKAAIVVKKDDESYDRTESTYWLGPFGILVSASMDYAMSPDENFIVVCDGTTLLDTATVTYDDDSDEMTVEIGCRPILSQDEYKQKYAVGGDYEYLYYNHSLF